MRWVIAVGMLMTLGWANVARADDPPSFFMMRRAVANWDAFTAAFPLSAAAACDADEPQRAQRGAQGTWTEADLTCNRHIETLAAVVATMTGGTFPPAEAVVAWCAAAEIVETFRPVVEDMLWGQRPDDQIKAARQASIWGNMTWVQQVGFTSAITVFGFILVHY